MDASAYLSPAKKGRIRLSKMVAAADVYGARGFYNAEVSSSIHLLS